MPVFKTYFQILKKRKLPIIIYAFLFFSLTVAFTSNIKIGDEKYEASKVNAMIINKDGDSSLVNGFIEYMGGYVDFVDPLEDEDAIKEALFYRRAVYILTIPEGFSKSFISSGESILRRQTVPDSIEAKSLDNIINHYFNVARVFINKVPDLDEDKLNTLIKDNMENETEVKFDIKIKSSEANSNEFNSYYFNYMAYVIIAAYITGVSMIMFSFSSIDIRRRHTASSISNRKLNIQLLLANLIFVLGFLVIFIMAGYDLNKGRVVNKNMLLTYLNAFIFSLTALSISYLVGITVKSRKAIGAISTFLSLGLSFISGIFVPQEFLGSAVLKVASFTPTYWYAKANNALADITTFSWSEVSSIYGYMAIEVGFTIAIISIALVVSKRKRLQAN